MLKSLKTFRRTLAVAGAATLASGAFAFTAFDAKILIERAINSPTMTVKYDGANVALVELRINGESFATRPASTANSKGEANFTVTITDLKDGENEVEVRLYDKTGKVISSQKQVMLTDQSNKGPVYLTGPKQGATVNGPVTIKLGFGQELKNSFVSFFIDGDHKSFTNTPPFEYVWDTQKEANGWHTVEAWVVDESTNTFKTKPVRVFVNNAGGRTERTGLGSGEGVVTKVGAKAGIEEISGELKSPAGSKTQKAPSEVTGLATPSVPVIKTNVVSTKAVTTKTVPSQSSNSTTSVASKTSVSIDLVKKSPTTSLETSVAQTRVPASNKTISMGNQDMTPTGLRVAGGSVLSKAPNFAAEAAKKVISVSKGTRLTGVKTFSVLLNGQYVEFDVAPRVDEGVPMTPFRHLIEKAGGVVGFNNGLKVVDASADGKSIWLKVGDANAKINGSSFALELAPYIDHGRTIVPLSFMKDALGVDIQFDPSTGHVLISKK